MSTSPGARSRAIARPATLALAALVALPVKLHAAPAPPTPTPHACQTRNNATRSRLLACVQLPSLWAHLARFQTIADANPGANGHGNRNTGSPGYRASVAYVASLMRSAGYAVTLQPYQFVHFAVTGTPSLSAGPTLTGAIAGRDFFVARLSAPGTLTAPTRNAATGCEKSDFAAFPPGRIALLERGPCTPDTAVGNAAASGAAAVILYNTAANDTPAARHTRNDGGAYPAYLATPAPIPVIAYAAHGLGQALIAAPAQPVTLSIATETYTSTDDNLIADSRFGDPAHTVVVDAHLDAIFGAGILDNASGSVSILDTALALAATPTANHLRFIWFGGEELGLLGSAHYTRTLSPQNRAAIAFDEDVDVTATPNYDVLIADPRFATNAARFPANVVPQSRVGNDAYLAYFRAAHIPATPAWFGNDGTDSNSFSLIGIPNTGILTQQDCCKTRREVAIWGGEIGNYEGDLGTFDGGCVDNPGRWCDNLANTRPAVLEAISRSVAAVTLTLANHAFTAAGR